VLSRLNEEFTVLASEPAAAIDALDRFNGRFPTAPDEYKALVEEATEVELQHSSGEYIRIWGPEGCIDQDEAYEISARIVGAVPIGDDGGGRIIFYINGHHGFGLYIVGYGDLDAEDATWVASNLEELLYECKGIDSF
jgi:hypothetical protein